MRLVLALVAVLLVVTACGGSTPDSSPTRASTVGVTVDPPAAFGRQNWCVQRADNGGSYYVQISSYATNSTLCDDAEEFSTEKIGTTPAGLTKQCGFDSDEQTEKTDHAQAIYHDETSESITAAKQICARYGR